MKKNICFLAVLFALITNNALSQVTTIVNYDFNSVSSYPVQPTATASNITCSGTSSEAFQTYTGIASGSSAFTQNSTSGNALAMANSGGTNTRYFLFQLGGSDLNAYSAYSLYLQPQRSSTGATTITVAYSTSGSSYTNLPTTYTVGTSFSETLIDLSSITALNYASAVYIKLMVSGASQTTGTIRIDNFEIQATKGFAGGNPFQVNGYDVSFSGKLAIGMTNPLHPLEVAGTSVFHGNQTIEGTSTSTNVNTGSITSTNVNTGIVTATTKLVSNRITYNDTAFHIGDSSMIFQTPNTVSNPAGGGIATYDRMYAGSSGLALGTAAVAGGSFSTSLGHLTKAYGSNSVAIGLNVATWGAGSVAIGNGTTISKAPNSIALGSYAVTDAAATNSIVLGRNIVNATPNSFMLGFSPAANSTIPTLFVGPAPSGILGGNVGIGTSSPSTALHVIGFATISSLGGNGTKTVIVDNNGKLAVGGNNTVDWMVGGNNISDPTNYANEYLGTSGNSDLVFATNGTPRMIIGKTNGNIGFGTSTAPAADFAFQKTNANCEVKLNTTIATKAPILSFDNSVHNANIYLGNLGNPSGPTPFVMDWNGSHFLSYSNGNMLIGDPDYLVGDPLAGGDIYTKLTISARTSANVNPWNVVPLRIVNPDLTIANKVVYEVLNDGTVTSAKLAGSGTRSVVVNDNGQLMAGALTSTTAVNWNLGGNNITNASTEFIGSTSLTQPFNIWAGNAQQISVKPNGKTVIGVSGLSTSNYAKLNVTDVASTGIEIYAQGINTAGYKNESQIRLQNDFGWVDLTQDERGVGRLKWATNNILSFHNNNLLVGTHLDPTYVGEANTNVTISVKTASGTANPLKIVNPDLTNINKTVFEVLADGTTHIGLTKQNGTHSNAMLTVDGKIVAKAAYVRAGDWADYVFDKNYKLMPLSEVEKYYTANKHLPEIPSEKEVIENGIDLGEMNKLLLKKVEELTIRMVEQEKRINELEKNK